MWTELEGSPDFSTTGVGVARLQRQFQTDRDTGYTAAAAQGYQKGQLLDYEGYTLTLVEISARNQNGLDVVTIVWQSDLPTGGRPQDYLDNRLRRDGDEEWIPEFGVEMVPASEALDYNGSVFSASWSVPADQALPNPTCYLVWKRWLDKNRNPPGSAKSTLPLDATQAINALSTYLPGATSSDPYEPPVPDGTAIPKLGYTLTSTGLGRKLVCVAIHFEPDGDLVCRIARFKWSINNWPSPPFGVPS